ncbi:MAG: adenosine kinase [Hyphomicrobiaceae bacterium]|nr:adenosine kinase [Hyphomicrobiaceae bacterium]
MTNARFDVLGIGNAIVDVLARCEDQFLSDNNLPKGHMRLIDTAEADRLYEVMGPAMEVSGGSAANSMAGLASFGGKAAFIGKVADDHLGEVFGHDLRAAGVGYETKAATQSGRAPTARCMIFVTPDGERTMNTFLGTSTELGVKELHAQLIKDALVTYLEGYLFDPPEAKEAFVEAARIAGEAGRKVALSLSDGFCVDRHRAAFRTLIAGGVDILFANEDELLSLYETEDFDKACKLARAECELIAVTRGAMGSVIITPDERIIVPAEPVSEVVDTTGAGDLYAAGFLYGYANDLDLTRCGRLAALAASEIISHMGARPEHKLDQLARDKGILKG